MSRKNTSVCKAFTAEFASIDSYFLIVGLSYQNGQLKERYVCMPFINSNDTTQVICYDAHTYANIYPDRQPSHAQAHLVIWTIYSHVNHYFVGMYTSLLSLVTSVIKIQPHILCNIPLRMQTKGNETKSARFQK